MSKSLSLLVAFAIFLSVLGEHSCYDDRKEFLKINHHLFDIVQSNDGETNMAEASRWLRDEVSTSGDKNLIKALETFTGLPRVLEDDIKCTSRAEDIIFENYRGAGNAKMLKVPTRVADVVSEYATKHNDICKEYLREETMAKLEKVDSETRQKVNSLMDELSTNDDYRELHTLSPKNEVDIVYRALKNLSKDDPDKQYLGAVANKREGRFTTHPDKVTELLKRYIIEPCYKFNKVLDLEDRFRTIQVSFYNTEGDSDERNNFKRLFEEYEICKKFISKYDLVNSKMIETAFSEY